MATYGPKIEQSQHAKSVSHIITKVIDFLKSDVTAHMHLGFIISDEKRPERRHFRGRGEILKMFSHHRSPLMDSLSPIICKQESITSNGLLMQVNSSRKHPPRANPGPLMHNESRRPGIWQLIVSPPGHLQQHNKQLCL